MKPGRFFFSGYGQNSISSISNFFEKINFLGFHAVVLVKTFPIDESITDVGLISTKPGRFFFSGYGQTDRHGFGILILKRVGTQKFQFKAQN